MKDYLPAHSDSFNYPLNGWQRAHVNRKRAITLVAHETPLALLPPATLAVESQSNNSFESRIARSPRR